MSAVDRVRFRGTDIVFQSFDGKSYRRVGISWSSPDCLARLTVNVLLKEGVFEEDVPPVAERLAERLAALVSVSDADAVELARLLIAHYGETKVLKVIEALR